MDLTIYRFARITTAFLILLFASHQSSAHNNPKFVNIPLESIQINTSTESVCVKPNEKAHSFNIKPPKETVRVVFEIEPKTTSDISFSLCQDNITIVEDLKNGSEVMPGKLDFDKPVFISNIRSDQDASITLKISARIIEEKKKKSSANTSAGKKVYKKANCVGCHKWHGDGGGGYGGAALSLRKTQLNADLIKYVVACGKPSSGMPYHGRKVYKTDNTDCYDSTAEELGEDLPPRARKLLSERELNAVVDYVVNVIQGSGEPTLEQCTAYWGEKSRQCDSFKKK